jgi:hypothetical protein
MGLEKPHFQTTALFSFLEFTVQRHSFVATPLGFKQHRAVKAREKQGEWSQGHMAQSHKLFSSTLQFEQHQHHQCHFYLL